MSSPSLSFCLSFFGRRWLSLGLFIPISSCGSFSPFLRFRSVPALLPSLVDPDIQTRKEQASLSSVALFCLLSIAPAGFPTCPSFNLTIVSPLYFEFTHAGTLPFAVHRPKFPI
ncbi:hypothetical protein CBS147343_9730 [Aspergillus niger]|nr:hypothetical protein CBS133816_7264 [Aspergillus niger]KAI2857983.1 hypothetical protein CBS12448_6264 [Aspergillus niger]KAI2932943.1 hypothetical protein CBS147320_1968 [Aspergillus niger]KAI2965224.1 hypothetical protein CBS147324_8113 [Aspergillus niger]KAI2989383.1 hypothetical protein CBS147344_3198 [Aspergillus niger]